MPQTIRLRLGDCLDVLKTMEPGSVGAFIMDPPYDLTSGGARGFMGKEWDGTGIAFSAEFWDLVFGVLAPDGVVKAFSGTRTYHRMATAMEKAGLVLDPEESLEAWAYGSGFPKSLNIHTKLVEVDPEEAEQFEGYGTALKPAWEPILVGRKPKQALFDGLLRRVEESGKIPQWDSKLLQQTPFAPLTKEQIKTALLAEFQARPVGPAVTLPFFYGIGVYVLYYQGDFPLYKPLAEANRRRPGSWSIYVGKVSAPGARTGLKQLEITAKLYKRIQKHLKLIGRTSNLSVTDFSVRFLNTGPSFVVAAEEILLEERPLWNSIVDGFGRNRANEADGAKRSAWDTLHPDGRKSVEALPVDLHFKRKIEQRVRETFNQFRIVEIMG